MDAPGLAEQSTETERNIGRRHRVYVWREGVLAPNFVPR